MARPKLHEDETILLAARKMLLKHGASISTKAIAAEIGLSQAAIFKRFGTKEALILQALLPTWPPDWVVALQQGPDDRSLLVQLEELERRLFDFYRQLAPRMMALRGAGLDLTALLAQAFDKPPPMMALEAIRQWLDRCKDRGLVRQDIDSEKAAWSVLGTVHAAAVMGHICKMESPPSLPEFQAKLLAASFEPTSDMEAS